MFASAHTVALAWLVMSRYEGYPAGNRWVASPAVLRAGGWATVGHRSPICGQIARAHDSLTLSSGPCTQYVFALHWALVAMTGVGPGVEPPETAAEAVMMLVLTVAGTACRMRYPRSLLASTAQAAKLGLTDRHAHSAGVTLYATFLGNLANMIGDSGRKMDEFNAKMKLVTQFMAVRRWVMREPAGSLMTRTPGRSTPCLPGCASRFGSFTSTSCTRSACRPCSCSATCRLTCLVRWVPRPLFARMADFRVVTLPGPQVVRQANADLIHQVPLFRDCRPEFVARLVMCLKPTMCLPGDMFIVEGDIVRGQSGCSATRHRGAA